MSRIRSVHPGFFKDDRLVPLSAFARLLFIGIGIEADDKGTFEWKPVTIKMSVFPGDNVDVLALLAELECADAIRRYEVDGRKYGAIRNFRRYQKPKTPNDVWPAPDEIRNYVGLAPIISKLGHDEPPAFPQPPPVEPPSFPQKGENEIQMEDGGGKGKEKIEPKAQHSETARAAPEQSVYDRLIAAASIRGPCHEKLVYGFTPIADLIAKGYDIDRDVLPVIRDRASPERRSWDYFVPIIIEAAAKRAAIPEAPKVPEFDWRKALEVYGDGTWAAGWGPKPGERGCRVPAPILAEFGFERAA